MMMEQIRSAAELEQRLAAEYAAAQADAKKQIALAQRAGARHVEDSRHSEELEARHRMEEAEQRAEAQTQSVLARAREDCEKLKQRAAAHMEETAQWIAEKVVEEQWQS